MYQIIKQIIITTVISSFLITACSAEGSQDPFIATSVAQTVAAQNAAAQATNTEIPSTPSTLVTQTPLQSSANITPLAEIPSPTISANSSNSTTLECAKASLISETIIDGTIYKPGEQFTKVWEIKNVSNCVWDTGYKIVFWSGDILGGAYYYDLPRVVGPGDIVPIALVLTTPTADGTYRSEWKLQTPDSIEFGVGNYDAAFYTEIAVSSEDKPTYGVASVTTTITREPPTGCPANTLYTVTATVSTNGPLEFTYFWKQKDGNDSSPKTFEIEAAGEKTFTRQWQFGRANTQGPKWISFKITDPSYPEQVVNFTFECP
jgi:Ig-like domain from next to BRCA1 gene